jgi:hypothetical protein
MYVNKYLFYSEYYKLGIIDELYDTDMTNLKWQNARSPIVLFSQGLRVMVTTMYFVEIKKFHAEAMPNISVCIYCNEKCTQYHILKCQNRKLSLREAALR